MIGVSAYTGAQGSSPAVLPSPLPAGGQPGFALYVHWPFCRAKCPYCDFNSHVRDKVDQGRWRRALLAELEHFAAEVPGRTLDAIFFGGGTPSLMAPDTAADIIAVARDFWPSRDFEVTLEANPTSVEAGRLRGFRDAGVNRVSLGIQALDDRSLAFLGREHSARDGLSAIGLAAGLFDRFSFDLIYARPDQTAAEWHAELRTALGLARDHLSLYQLTIEPGTRFHSLQAAGRLAIPDDETQAGLWEVTQTLTAAAGLQAYEVSNHARPGSESRHNLVYWRSGDWLGVGPGAHGRLTSGAGRIGTETLRLPEAWLRQVEARGHGEKPRTPLSPEDQVAELLLMGLRLGEGVSIDRLERAAAACPADPIDRQAYERMVGHGLLSLDEGRLKATQAGRQRLTAVLASLLR
jgi:oxygen-independent coproporphyrinogen-3 oxidase